MPKVDVETSQVAKDMHRVDAKVDNRAADFVDPSPADRTATYRITFMHDRSLETTTCSNFTQW
jgi:hypothetical protein